MLEVCQLLGLEAPWLLGLEARRLLGPVARRLERLLIKNKKTLSQTVLLCWFPMLWSDPSVTVWGVGGKRTQMQAALFKLKNVLIAPKMLRQAGNTENRYLQVLTGTYRPICLAVYSCPGHATSPICLAVYFLPRRRVSK